MNTCLHVVRTAICPLHTGRPVLNVLIVSKRQHLALLPPTNTQRNTNIQDEMGAADPNRHNQEGLLLLHACATVLASKLRLDYNIQSFGG